MNPLTIEPATLEDIPAIVALERSAVEAPHWSEEFYRTTITANSTEGALQRNLLVARRSGTLIGFAVGSLLGQVAELESVAVAAANRRTGAGRALCSAVVAWAWAQGATEMVLEVRASSLGAIELYCGLSFALSGLRPGYYHAPEDDAVLMRLEHRKEGS